MTKWGKRCAWCGGEVVSLSGPGRPRKYCRTSHRQRAYEARKAAQAYRLAPDEVVLAREGWEAMRAALAQLEDVSEQLAGRLATGNDPAAGYLHSVARLTAAVAELQAKLEPKAAW